MNDAEQWLINLMIGDIALCVGAVVGALFTIELLVRVRSWLSRAGG